MARILAVGIATVDIINTVSAYPPEDSEVRAIAQRVCRGGNATNTLVVLAQQGHACSWAGVLVDEADSRHIEADLATHGIDTRHCRRLDHGKMPTSYILLNEATGSRSIVHYRDLPEYRYVDFEAIDLGSYDWLHFEGRNVAETARMLARARQLAPQVPRSVEIEKPRDDIEALFEDADLLMFSRDYARYCGMESPDAFLDWCEARLPRRDRVLTWGEAGAWFQGRDGSRYAVPAQPPAQLVDTLGAGDTFNAGIIDARLRGCDWLDSLARANRLAGRKCGQPGFAGLGAE